MQASRRSRHLLKNKAPQNNVKENWSAHFDEGKVRATRSSGAGSSVIAIIYEFNTETDRKTIFRIHQHYELEEGVTGYCNAESAVNIQLLMQNFWEVTHYEYTLIAPAIVYILYF